MSEQERNTTGNTNPNQNQDQNAGSNPNTGFNQHPNNTGQNAASFQIGGNWAQQSSQLKERYNELSDSDLDFQPGQENQLLDQLGTKLNKSPEEVHGILNQFNQPNNSSQGNNESNRKNETNNDEAEKFTL